MNTRIDKYRGKVPLQLRVTQGGFGTFVSCRLDGYPEWKYQTIKGKSKVSLPHHDLDGLFFS